jgi:peptidoglycan/xylan/chitin deacetylase (PgdA/CDA1 family)
MKTFLWILGFLLAGMLPAAAQGASQVALFQPKTIFHSGLLHAHTVALTLDDGPNTHTEEVLDVLKKYNIKATFFVVGKMAHRHPQILERIAREGHLLANHSADHAFLGASYDSNPEKLLSELRDVDSHIEPLMRPDDKLYFRAPYGAWKSAHAEILNKDPTLRNYVGPIYWDIGGDVAMSRDGYVMSAADWNCWHLGWSARTCAKGYLREIRRKNGGVVLIHCIHPRSADLIAAIVPALLEEGYQFVRLDQMPAYRPYETPGANNGFARVDPPSPKRQPIRVSELK